MKKCFGCNKLKPLSDYYKHRSMSDGHLNKCKICIGLQVKERRAKNPAVQEHDRKRGNRQSKDYTKEYRQKYPKKYKATNWINNALRDGRLLKRGPERKKSVRACPGISSACAVTGCRPMKCRTPEAINPLALRLAGRRVIKTLPPRL